MANEPALVIPDTMADLMIADSDFDTINLFLIGEAYKVPNQHYPLCEIVAEDEVEDPADTGNIWRVISGIIRFSVREQEQYTVTSRKGTEPTYTKIYTYLQAASDLFNKQSNRTLGNLTFTPAGLAVEFEIEGEKTYGVGARDNSYEQQGVVSWSCRIKEPRDFT